LTEKKNEKFGLKWICPLTGRKHPAGVAFFNEEQGDYRLKVDVMPDDKVLYLKVSSMADGKVFVSSVRDSGARIFAGSVYQLPARDAGGFQLQKKRLLSQLRSPADGRNSGTLSRSRAPTQKHSSMGADISSAD